MEILARSRLTSKEQLSLPVSIRRLLQVHAGDELIWIRDDDGRILVSSAGKQTLADIRAAVAAVGPVRRCTPVSTLEMKRDIARYLRKKHGRR